MIHVVLLAAVVAAKSKGFWLTGEHTYFGVATGIALGGIFAKWVWKPLKKKWDERQDRLTFTDGQGGRPGLYGPVAPGAVRVSTLETEVAAIHEELSALATVAGHVNAAVNGVGKHEPKLRDLVVSLVESQGTRDERTARIEVNVEDINKTVRMHTQQLTELTESGTVRDEVATKRDDVAVATAQTNADQSRTDHENKEST